MPDLLSGSPVTPLDTPPTVDDREDGSFTFNATTFGVDNDSGTYADCGVAFLAPTTGRVLILWGGNLANSTSASTLLGPVVRTGGTVGSGSVVLAGANPIASGMQGGDAVKAGRSHLLTGLTPGDTYNVRLEHRVTAGIGTISERNVIVCPAT